MVDSSLTVYTRSSGKSMIQLIGAHMSISGGVDKAIDRGEKLGCTAIQVFVGSNLRLFSKPLDSKTLCSWYEKLKNAEYLQAILAHAGYFINLASPDDEKWDKYIEALADELNKCDQLGIENLTLHPGSTLGNSVEWGIKRIASAIDIVYDKYGPNSNIALETDAGQGYHIGWRFEHLRDIIEASAHKEKLRVVFDTAHAFAAGYDFTSKTKYEKMWYEFDGIIGLEKLVGLHINDSKKSLGTRKDRHQHIGKGYIGVEAFRYIMQDAKFISVPKILETPKENDWDSLNLKLLWDLANEKQN